MKQCTRKTTALIVIIEMELLWQYRVSSIAEIEITNI
jgi:hypothetical protein